VRIGKRLIIFAAQALLGGAALISALFLFDFTEDEADPIRLEKSRTPDGRIAVDLIDDQGRRTLGNFKPPLNVYEFGGYGLSPDSQYAMVVYTKPDEQKKVVIYRTDTTEVEAMFSAYSRADVSWTRGNTIMLKQGCGTNCMGVAFYDVHGRLLHSESADWIDISKDRKFYATYPTTGCPESASITIRNMVTLGTVCEVIIGPRNITGDLTWVGEGQARVTTYGNCGETENQEILFSFSQGCSVEYRPLEREGANHE
jgi:hypothetical protein